MYDRQTSAVLLVKVGLESVKTLRAASDLLLNITEGRNPACGQRAAHTLRRGHEPDATSFKRDDFKPFLLPEEVGATQAVA